MKRNIKANVFVSVSLLLCWFQINSTARENEIFQEGEKVIRVLLITGAETLLHQFNRLAPSGFYQMLYECKDIIWDHALSDEAAFNEDIRDQYDVVIFFSYFSHITGNARKNLYDFIESGRGIIAFHSALASYNDWDWWWNDVLGAKYQYEFDPVYKKSESHKPETINLKAAADHPITEAVGNFSITDEIYQNLVFSDNEITVLYKNVNANNDAALVWIGPHKKSRVVVIQPGHGRDGSDAYINSNFKNLLHECIKWSCGK